MELKLVAYHLAAILVVLLQKGGHAQVTITAAPTTATVAENVAAGTSLSDLTATGGSSPYTFSISGTNTKFQIATAQLQTNMGLDYETMVENVVVILATDNANPAVTGSLTFTLTLTDANDAPTFAQANGYTFYIANNAPAATTVGTVTATDQDSGTNGNIASYTITTGNTDTTFAISSAGVITVAATKMADDFPYALEVVAADGASPALSATTTVVIVMDNSSGASKNAGFVAVMVSLVHQAVKYI